MRFIVYYLYFLEERTIPLAWNSLLSQLKRKAQLFEQSSAIPVYRFRWLEADNNLYIISNQMSRNQTQLYKSSNDSQGISSKYITIIIILVVAIAILVICIVKRCMDCHRMSRQSQDNNRNIVSERGMVASNMPEEPMLQKEWAVNLTRYTKQGMRDENCSICLSTHPHCLTDCGHFFHKRCIWEWLKVKMDCPLCKSSNISILTIYCHSCYGNVYKCRSGQLTQSFDSVDYCMNCR